MKLHRLIDASRFRVIRTRYLDFNAKRREALLTPGGQTLPRYRGLMEFSLELAGMAIVLELGDETVQSHLDEAVAAARGWLNAPTPPGTSSGLQSTFVDARVEPSGEMSFKTTPLPQPARPPEGRDDWHIGVFSMVLDTLAAFGPPEAARQAAAAPEEWYRSEEVVAEEAYFADVRGRKCWLMGDDDGARTACSEAARTAREPLFRATSNALLSLIDERPAEFHQALGEIVKAHKRMFTRAPERADGVFTLEGLGLCRIARTCGIEVTDDTYLPVRLPGTGSLRV
jgi:hypothetical protein